MSTTAKAKKNMRKKIKQTFETIDSAKLQEKSERIYRTLFAWSFWQQAQVVATTISTHHEINTIPIIEKGWEEGKVIAVPKAEPKKHLLHFYEIRSFSDIKQQFRNIYEPIPSLCRSITADEFDLMIVPGLAFDRQLFRLGFGGGFYDRYLQGKNIFFCSLALDFQLVEQLPTESHDIPLDALITEKGIYYRSQTEYKKRKDGET